MNSGQKPGKIWVVVDNKAADGLVAEHGFALWIETADRVVLFDTGNKEALAPNCSKLQLDLSRITELVLSHGHYDHTGGIETVLRATSDIQIYLHQAAMQPRYVGANDDARPVRMSAASMQSLWQLQDDSIHWLTHPFKLTTHIGITGPISRITEYEDAGDAFFYDPLGERPDPIEDDNALWLHTENGLVVCVGCSHAGIVNTLKRIIEITGESRIQTVIGGLHLINASPERLEKTVQALNEYDIQQLVACHCTGDRAATFLTDHLKCEVVQGYAGFSMSI